MSTQFRLDNYLVEKGFLPSLAISTSSIMSGKILVNGEKITKCGTLISDDSEIRILGKNKKFVSRGGEKLAGALENFDVSVANRVALDIGLSTGGFTDCLVKKQADAVIGVDVGYGDVDYTLRQKPNVIVLERCNARHLSSDDLKQAKLWKNKALPSGRSPSDAIANIDLVVMDVSFISILKILPALISIIRPGSDIISLVKPQFEAPADMVPKGGIITDPETHDWVLDHIQKSAKQMGLELVGQCTSPIQGQKGNIEFFYHLRKD